MNSEGFVGTNTRVWYDVCKKCSRIVSPRHTSCPKCGSTEFTGTIRNKDGTFTHELEKDDI